MLKAKNIVVSLEKEDTPIFQNCPIACAQVDGVIHTKYLLAAFVVKSKELCLHCHLPCTYRTIPV